MRLGASGGNGNQAYAIYFQTVAFKALAAARAQVSRYNKASIAAILSAVFDLDCVKLLHGPNFDASSLTSVHDPGNAARMLFKPVVAVTEVVAALQTFSTFFEEAIRRLASGISGVSPAHGSRSTVTVSISPMEAIKFKSLAADVRIFAACLEARVKAQGVARKFS